MPPKTPHPRVSHKYCDPIDSWALHNGVDEHQDFLQIDRDRMPSAQLGPVQHKGLSMGNQKVVKHSSPRDQRRGFAVVDLLLVDLSGCGSLFVSVYQTMTLLKIATNLVDILAAVCGCGW